MIAVIFEVVPAPGNRKRYLDLAAELKQELGRIDGFVSAERFQSLADPDRILSLSFFRDERAVAAWRNTASHRETQAHGRGGVFADYRLRVAEVVRDYGMNGRAGAPRDSRAVHQCGTSPPPVAAELVRTKSDATLPDGADRRRHDVGARG